MPYSKKEARNTWFRSRYRERKDFLKSYKESKGCVECGYNKTHKALQLDHRPEIVYKSKNFANYLHKSEKLFQEQLALLDVVCANCHAIRSFDRGQYNGK